MCLDNISLVMVSLASFGKQGFTMVKVLNKEFEWGQKSMLSC